MVGGRLKEAMSDLAETIRRVFQPPASRPVPLALADSSPGRMPPLETAAGKPFDPCAATPMAASLLGPVPPVSVPVAWTAQVGFEPGLSDWDAGVRACALPMFASGGCTRVEVPSLPRRPGTRRERPAEFAARSRSGWTRPDLPGIRRGLQPLGGYRVHGGLPVMLRLPMAVAGEDPDRLPKALMMRYNLQLVRTTGENIRNLEVIRVYRIPAKGTEQIRHDPATGRLLVTLGPAAAGAGLAPFILARRKTDASIVCCLVEES
jgi:hypothetical protein